MCRPSRRTLTRPTSSKTRRCFETDGCSSPSESTISPTGRSCSAIKFKISRRRGSATALNASEVVAARAIPAHYIPIWEYVKHYFFPPYPVPLPPRQTASTSWFHPGEKAPTGRLFSEFGSLAQRKNVLRLQAPPLPRHWPFLF